jgi:DNA replication protein DnaC
MNDFFNHLKTKNMNEETLQKMRQLKFFGMVRAFKTSMEQDKLKSMTADDLIAFLIESEWDDRNNRRITRNLRNAHFRYKTGIEQIDFENNRNLDKNQIMRFVECKFIDKAENILITGSTGIGKSFIASAIGN